MLAALIASLILRLTNASGVEAVQSAVMTGASLVCVVAGAAALDRSMKVTGRMDGGAPFEEEREWYAKRGMSSARNAGDAPAAAQQAEELVAEAADETMGGE